jgi:predicted DNA-binding protein YlxM (UPF0122 family)
MKTEKEIKEKANNLINAAKNVSWKDVDKLKKITKNLHLLRTSLALLTNYKTKESLMELKESNKDSESKEHKEQAICINYLITFSS